MSFEEVELLARLDVARTSCKGGTVPMRRPSQLGPRSTARSVGLTAVSARIESDSMIHRRPAVRKQRHRLPLSFFTRKITKDQRPDPNAKPDVALAHDRESALAHRDGGRTAVTTVRRSCRPEGVLCHSGPQGYCTMRVALAVCVCPFIGYSPVAVAVMV
jgi:hypothetical protein